MCQGWIHLYLAVGTEPPHGATSWNGPKTCALLSVLNRDTQDTEGHSVHCPRRNSRAHIAVAYCIDTPSKSLFNGSCCTVPTLTCGLWSRSYSGSWQETVGRTLCLAVTAFLHSWRKMECLFSPPPSIFSAFFSSVADGILSETDRIPQGVSCSVSGVSELLVSWGPGGVISAGSAAACSFQQQRTACFFQNCF